MAISDGSSPFRLKAESDELMTLDFLRIVASLGVVIYHYRYYAWLPPGVAALGLDPFFARQWVDLFFVVSGFVIAYVYAGRLRTAKDYGRFLQKRAARLIPLHWATLAFFVLVGLAALAGVKADSAERFDWGCLLPNLLLIHAYGICPAVSFNTVSWSISAEMLMYVLFPLLAMLASATRGIAAFAIGIGLYHARGALARVPFAEPALFVLLAAFVGFGVAGAPALVTLAILYAIVALAIAVDMGPGPGALVRRLGIGGQLTYSIYMLHPVIATLMMVSAKRLLHLHDAALDVWLVVTFAVLVFVSALSLHYFEQPMRHWLGGLGRRRSTAGAAS